jgi:hypothetical protein
MRNPRGPADLKLPAPTALSEQSDTPSSLALELDEELSACHLVAR